MTLLDRYLSTGLKALEGWQPMIEARLGRRTPSPEAAPEPGDPLATGDSLNANALSSPALDLPWPPTLEALIEQCGTFPPYSLVLGACDDGLPFVLDLTLAAPGALLICGDADSGKERLLKGLLASAVRLNPSDKVNLSIVAQDPEEYFELADAEHCQEIFATDEESTGELIKELAEIVEERKRSRPGDPAYILALDNLAACLEFQDEETYTRLYWLIRHGPRSRVWTIATLPTDRAAEIDPRFLSAFRTRLVGAIADDEMAGYLAGEEGMSTRDLEGSGQFLVPYGGEWLRFCPCEPDSKPHEPSENTPS
jgi:hypothetical protein